jgi:hypothetical protein
MTTDNDTNRENAKYFVSTVLGEEILEIDLLPQEYTYYPNSKKNNGLEKEEAAEAKAETVEKLSVIRMDFVATIRTKSGERKRVLIELQKSNKRINPLRFRTYLGEQYKQFYTVQINDKIEKTIPFPIVVIYILDYTLPEYNAIVMKRNETYTDLIRKRAVKATGENPYVDLIIHDSYFIQVPRINGKRYKKWDKCSEIEQLLSLFEQNYFVDQKYTKRYPYLINNKNIKRMIETLEYTAADPVTRRIMQEEQWAAMEEEMWQSENKALRDYSFVNNKKVVFLRGLLIIKFLNHGNQKFGYNNSQPNLRCSIQEPDDNGQ